jgi:outer membrane protein assembly factor BamB
VNNTFRYFVFLILLNSCSLDTKSGIWTDKKKLKAEVDTSIQVFAKSELLDKEFNSNLKIKLTSKLVNNSFINNLTNNNGRINYDGELKKISKFKFSKIDNFDYYEPELIFEADNLIFFDKRGSIIKFNSNSEIIWEKNFYNKSEKKLKPILTFGQSSKTLIIADNISKYYAINLKNGNLLWSKYNNSPFNSQIKVYKNKFFIIDFNNVLRCISLTNGAELWNIKASNTFIKSQKKLSIIVVNNVLYFNNSTGDITAVDIDNGTMLWQRPTQNNLAYIEDFSLKTSDIIGDKNSLFFSNNKNQFFSIDLETGALNWQQKINSNLRSTLIDDYIFSVSTEGYLIIIQRLVGCH